MSAPNGTEKYVYVVHGLIPELMCHVAYRRARDFVPPGRKTIKCPHCAHRLTDTEDGTKVELYRHPAELRVSCQIYLKCGFCHKEVGIKIA